MCQDRLVFCLTNPQYRIVNFCQVDHNEDTLKTRLKHCSHMNGN